MDVQNIGQFFQAQIAHWPLACKNFRALKNAQEMHLSIGGLDVVLQHNPERMISSAAKLDKESIQARKCFLCAENRPPEQRWLKFEGRKGKKYDILVNPYPIFSEHFVIAAHRHFPQGIWKRYVDMLDLSKKFHDHVFFYNGPQSGASAPDHHHFQATKQERMPLEKEINAMLDSVESGATMPDALEHVSSHLDAELYHFHKFTTGIFVLCAKTVKSSAKLFYRLLDCAPTEAGETEPRFNLITSHNGKEFRSIVIFRSRHRSHHYFSDGPDHLTMSPGCADMGGLIVVPVKEDFEKLGKNAGLLEELIAEVSISKEQEDGIIRKLTRRQPLLNVGIMSAAEIVFEVLSDGAGPRKAAFRDGKIEYDGTLYDELYFGENTLSTMFAGPTFKLYGVTIGKNFHWQRQEDQTFAGSLKIIVENGALTAVNVVGVEDYLVSVISSEMKATAPLEFLKAHTVISRSWVMAQIAGHKEHAPVPANAGQDEIIRWYDHSDHDNYDVCADDHCQRYQGLTKAIGDAVRRAVDETWGETLTYGGEICDARFSKCCGGTMEKFSSCWEDRDYPYLQAIPDTFGHSPDGEPFCAQADSALLAQVLNNYDLETEDFYRWKVEYGVDELSYLVERRGCLGLGKILALEPVEVGDSGRIIRLRIVGSLRTVVVGKELEIRRLLSESHLKSSAFSAEFSGDRVVLTGRGWGHGVGLCQIGAAVMASQGYGYKEILMHYYPESEIKC